MDESRDRSRSFHGVGQPNVQRKLRGLSHGTAKNQEHGNGQKCRIAGEAPELRDDVVEKDGASRAPDHENAKHETEIADAIGDESFFSRIGRGIALEPVANEQIGTEADQLPEDEQHNEIVREHDAQHREHEERKGGEITRFAGIIPHVAERINMDQTADAGDKHKHGFAQLIESKGDWNAQYSREIDPRDFRGFDLSTGKNKASASETDDDGED